MWLHFFPEHKLMCDGKMNTRHFISVIVYINM